jgi:hypothetical protein
MAQNSKSYIYESNDRKEMPKYNMYLNMVRKNMK